jgi:ATP-dependent protease HslVU (ClpYQ) peptidase subunit
MTVIAVKKHKDKIVIGSDSIRAYGSTQQKLEYGKLKKLDGFIFGHAGAAVNVTLMCMFAKTHKIDGPNEDAVSNFMAEYLQWCKKKINDYKFESQFLFVIGGKIFVVFQDLCIYEIEDYYAIGAGMDFALASLYLGKSVKEAVEAACELSIYCEKPINMIEEVQNE